MGKRTAHTPALPAPRLQFRWVPGEETRYQWACVYEIVLPLREHDFRRERGNHLVTEVALEISRTNRDSDEDAPNDMPFRDGARAAWDNKALGGHLPIIVLNPYGEPFVREMAGEFSFRMVPFVAGTVPAATLSHKEG